MIALVIGREGQLARSLAELNLPFVKVVAVGRPSVDLLKPRTVTEIIDSTRPDIVINAAAYTDVDKAERETELATAINGEGPGLIGRATAARKIPVVHISTDYVYDGYKTSPYLEEDHVHPLNAYGRSKLAGEGKLAKANPRHIILRTAWVHSPFGRNFVRTMLNLARTRSEVSVVNDQRGNPTYAPHLAECIAVMVSKINGAHGNAHLWGIYHAVGGGDTTWFGLAQGIFKCAAKRGIPVPHVKGIAAADRQTLAARPTNSRLDTSKLERTFGITLPHWTAGVDECVGRVLTKAPTEP